MLVLVVIAWENLTIQNYHGHYQNFPMWWLLRPAFLAGINLYEKLQPDWARFWPESGHKPIKAAVIERDTTRHWLCLSASYERDICIACLWLRIWPEWAWHHKTNCLAQTRQLSFVTLLLQQNMDDNIARQSETSNRNSFECHENVDYYHIWQKFKET